MYNWSVDTSQFDRGSRQYKVWRLEQLINYGLGGEMLDRKDLQKFLPELKIDPAKRRYLEFLLKQNAPTN